MGKHILVIQNLLWIILNETNEKGNFYKSLHSKFLLNTKKNIIFFMIFMFYVFLFAMSMVHPCEIFFSEKSRILNMVFYTYLHSNQISNFMILPLGFVRENGFFFVLELLFCFILFTG
jgi:Fe2+ transport system protein B